LMNLRNSDTLCSQECVGQMDEQPMRATVSPTGKLTIKSSSTKAYK
jgi:hypothetical protein